MNTVQGLRAFASSVGVAMARKLVIKMQPLI